ncbi:cyclase family protein [Fictibacillus aquaticus]|uniref:Kynurenine formamidase n=1 Tax=Fictibacillus aquaticus TaxID=2021314 RepID=A0A235FBJ8_9BACL|nr:cyclase family protein [Fictibacillus aquaticus]OYD58718.1 cyclase [Fictibacillus aquaticus]
MKIYDVSSTIFSGMAVYKNKEEKQPVYNTVQSGYVTETRIDMDAHTGTHVDAPLHMVPGGDTIETLPLESLVRECKVIDMTHVDGAITKEHLTDKDIQSEDFVLFKTKNSMTEEFDFDFVYVGKCAAEYLAEKGITGVGVDALGIERSQEGHPTHKTLFEKKIIIIEGLRLKEVQEGRYFMMAAPLKMTGTDASPARIILLDNFGQ